MPPDINQEFPVRNRANLSPPIVRAPINDCARAAFVSGFIPRATVRVIANGSEVLAQVNPPDGFAEVRLSRALNLGDVIVATQTVGPVTSGPSYDPVTVGKYPSLTTPVAGPATYACGRIVPVGNLVPSTHVEVHDLDAGNSVIGTAESTGDWEAVITSPLVNGHRLQVVQLACRDIPAKRVVSPLSAPITVNASPMPVPPPVLDSPPVGAQTATLHNLLVGADVQVRTGASVIGGGLATGPDNWTDLTTRVTAAMSLTATQKLCTSSGPSAPVQPTTRIGAPVLGSPICEGSRYVTVQNTIMNASVILVRAGAIIGYAGGTTGTLTMAIGATITLNAGDALSVIQYTGGTVSPPSNSVVVGCTASADVVTHHNDNFRTGAYTAETILTPAAVRSRRMQIAYRHPVDGPIAAQPLYVRGVQFGETRANGLFVATMNNMVYGLDADTGVEKWAIRLLDSQRDRRPLTRAIFSTPVIDRATNRMYVVFSTKNQALDSANCPDSTRPDPSCGTYEDQLSSLDVAYWLVALDIRNGTEFARTRVAASLFRTNGSVVTFTGKNQVDRPALLLDHGFLYLALGMRFREEIIEYHGWVLRYRASNLAFDSAFCTSRNSTVPTSPFTSHLAEGAGIWQGGGGLAADADGNVYALTGNAKADIPNYSFGDVFLKLTGSSLSPTAFVPSGAGTLEANDADLGSGGPMTIPGTSYVLGGGKTGFMYLMNESSMTLRQQFTASTNLYDPTQRDQGWDVGPHLHGSPTYWRGPNATSGNLYVWGEKDVLRHYLFNIGTGMMTTTPVNQGAVRALRDTMPGGMISLSSNGNRSGSAIVWATLPESDVIAPGANAYPGHLYAYHAETLDRLWDTSFSSLGKWVPPTIAGGKVFIGTSSNEVIAYKLGGVAGMMTTKMESAAPIGRGHRAGLRELYEDEESVRALPTMLLNQLAPPEGNVRRRVLEGDGTDKDAELRDAVTKTVVYLRDGTTLAAADGSKAALEEVKRTPAAENGGLPWVLYRVKETSGDGVLSGATYVARVFVEALPSGQYHAQWFVYERSGKVQAARR